MFINNGECLVQNNRRNTGIFAILVMINSKLPVHFCERKLLKNLYKIQIYIYTNVIFCRSLNNASTPLQRSGKIGRIINIGFHINNFLPVTVNKRKLICTLVRRLVTCATNFRHGILF